MRVIAESCRDLSLFLAIHSDRLLAPALVATALTLTGWIVSILSGA
jgi:hypothetical protein